MKELNQNERFDRLNDLFSAMDANGVTGNIAKESPFVIIQVGPHALAFVNGLMIGNYTKSVNYYVDGSGTKIEIDNPFLKEAVEVIRGGGNIDQENLRMVAQALIDSPATVTFKDETL